MKFLEFFKLNHSLRQNRRTWNMQREFSFHHLTIHHSEPLQTKTIAQSTVCGVLIPKRIGFGALIDCIDTSLGRIPRHPNTVHAMPYRLYAFSTLLESVKQLTYPNG